MSLLSKVCALLLASAAIASEERGLRAGYLGADVVLFSNTTALSQSSAQAGVDISVSLTSTVAACLLTSDNLDFVIPRGYRSTGAIDTAVCGSLSVAQAAGVPVRDTYMFPCPTCSKSAAVQFQELAAHLSENCADAFSGRVWLDIEGSQYWLGDNDANREWYQELVDACTSSEYRCGVYSSQYQWADIFGSSEYIAGSNLGLNMWYAHYDNSPSFADYPKYSFGGWTTPTAKQYQGDVDFCNVDSDRNYAVEF